MTRSTRIGLPVALALLLAACGQNAAPEAASQPGSQATRTLAAQAVANGTYQITVRGGGLALDVEGQGQANGAHLTQYTYWGGQNQQFRVEHVRDGYYKITAVNSGRALDVEGWSQENGAHVTVYDDHGGDNQLWRIEPTDSGYVRIVSKHSGLALDVEGQSRENGAHVTQYTYWGGENQQFKLSTLGGSTTPAPTPEPIPPPTPTPGTRPAVLNILVRGQSNAILFMEHGGWAAAGNLEREVGRLLGFDGTGQRVRLIYDRFEDDGAATAFGGSSFLRDWLNPVNGDWRQGWQAARLENMLLNQVRGLSAEERAAPAAVLWLHSENDTRDVPGLTPEEWMSGVRFDANLVRGAWGKSAAELPYLFVEAHPYWGDPEAHQAIRRGMERLTQDTAFGADIATRALDLNIDNDNTDDNWQTVEYGTSHIGASDALLLSGRIARVVAEEFARYANPGSPVAQAGGNIDDHGPQVVTVQRLGTTTLRVTVRHDGAASGFAALDEDAARGLGWSVRSSSGNVEAASVRVLSGTQLEITFNGAIPVGGRLFYGYGYGRLAEEGQPGQGNAVYDNEGMPIWVSAEGLPVQ